ncbi:MAG: hypothetical protein IPH08_09740 [Rhodocyclaceae bacterium]|nr:hypothetical protein [Rhodocyclaceae bacterium]
MSLAPGKLAAPFSWSPVMTQLIARLLNDSRYAHPADPANFADRQNTDVVVFFSTTCLCALGALMLPLVG